MKNLFTAIALSVVVISTPTHADDSWWELGAAVVGLGVALSKESRNQDVRDTGRKAEIIMGSINDGQGFKKHIMPDQYESNPQAYAQWVKVPRVKHLFMPEMDEGNCVYKMRAGMIDIPEPRGGCPKYIAVHPNNFY